MWKQGLRYYQFMAIHYMEIKSWLRPFLHFVAEWNVSFSLLHNFHICDPLRYLSGGSSGSGFAKPRFPSYDGIDIIPGVLRKTMDGGLVYEGTCSSAQFWVQSSSWNTSAHVYRLLKRKQELRFWLFMSYNNLSFPGSLWVECCNITWGTLSNNIHPATAWVGPRTPPPPRWSSSPASQCSQRAMQYDKNDCVW